ncbi:MAG TPA: right-handed parallel beta-helix repeat-containing protein [Thermoplasmata archaeon]|nr:right-handed parallel beta-helix repeat-containing protein [Thermoplasmata archaeon]
MRRGISGALAAGLLITFALALVLAPGEVAALTPHAPISINGNADFIAANGVVAGAGTSSNPYVISGWEIDASAAHGIEIRNTNAYVVVRDVYVHSGGTSFDGLLFSLARNVRVENVTAVQNRDGLDAFSLRDSVITGSNFSQNSGFGVSSNNAENLEITGSVVAGNGQSGISVLALGPSVQVRNNTVTGNNWTAIAVTGDGVTVSGNAVVGATNWWGILVSGLDVLLSGNEISGATHGIYVLSASNATVEDNRVWGNEWGIVLTSVTNFTAVRNNVTASSEVGIGLLRSSVGLVADSESTGGKWGVYLNGSANVTIARNDLTPNTWWSISAVNSTGLLIHHNDLSAADVYDDRGNENQWDDGYPSGGNYWEGYSGVDNCNGPNQDVCTGPDGIGDTSQYVFPEGQDRYPIVALVPNTPPVARLSVTPPSGYLLTEFSFGANDSTDNEDSASVLEARWDFDDDGVWDTGWYLLSIHQKHSYPTAGNRTVVLAVRDSRGLENTTRGLAVVLEDLVAPTIVHAPSAAVSVGDAIVLSANVTDGGEVQAAEVHYRTPGDADFITLPMTREGGLYVVTLGGPAKEGTYTYYITARDRAGNEARLPASGEYAVEARQSLILDWRLWVVVIAASVAILAVILVARRRGRRAAAPSPSVEASPPHPRPPEEIHPPPPPDWPPPPPDFEFPPPPP